MTKAELEAQVAQLQNEILERQASWDKLVDHSKVSDSGDLIGSVSKGNDGQVILTAGLMTVDEWIYVVARMSVGGANGANLATIRKVHTGI